MNRKPKGPENENFIGSGDFWRVLALIVLVAVAAGSLIYGSYQCEGTYVRGLFWMECIE